MIHLGKDSVQGQDHIGQVVIHHTQDNSPGSADQLHSVQTDSFQEVIDDAGILQKSHPSHSAEQKAHTHRQHDQHIEDLLGHRLPLGNIVGNGIAHQKADHCCRQGIAYAAHQSRPVVLDLEDVIPSEGPGCRIGERIVGHHTQRDQGEQHHEEDVGAAQKEGFILLHRLHPPSVRRTLQSRNCSHHTCRSIHSCA